MPERVHDLIPSFAIVLWAAIAQLYEGIGGENDTGVACKIERTAVLWIFFFFVVLLVYIQMVNQEFEGHYFSKEILLRMLISFFYLIAINEQPLKCTMTNKNVHYLEGTQSAILMILTTLIYTVLPRTWLEYKQKPQSVDVASASSMRNGLFGCLPCARSLSNNGISGISDSINKQ